MQVPRADPARPRDPCPTPRRLAHLDPHAPAARLLLSADRDRQEHAQEVSALDIVVVADAPAAGPEARPMLSLFGGHVEVRIGPIVARLEVVQVVLFATRGTPEPARHALDSYLSRDVVMLRMRHRTGPAAYAAAGRIRDTAGRTTMPDGARSPLDSSRGIPSVARTPRASVRSVPRAQLPRYGRTTHRPSALLVETPSRR